MQKLRHLPHARDQNRRVAGFFRIQGTEAVHYHRVPRALAQHIELVIQVPVDADTGFGFHENIVRQAGLRGEGFEQGRHAALPAAIQIGNRIGAVVAHRRAVCEGEAVADEQDAAGQSLGRESVGREEPQPERECPLRTPAPKM